MNDTHDRLYEVLANEQRRQLLFGLLDENPQTDTPIDLDTPPDDIATEKTERIEQRHVHLPKLDEYGFIEWTPSTNCIEKGPQFGEIRSTLEILSNHHEKVSV